MSDWAGIVWLVVLLLGNAFFVAAEFAVISARRSQIEPLAESGKRGAKTALFAMEHATAMLATCQLGITVCSLLILNVSEPAIHHLLEGPLHWTGLSAPVVSVLAFTLTLVLVSYLHVVFGEMVPKNISFSLPERSVVLLAGPLVAISRMVKPVISLLNLIANGVLRLARIEPQNEVNSTYTLDEVATIVGQSTQQGMLEDSTGALSAAFEFTEKRVSDVAIKLQDLVTLPQGLATASMIESAVTKHGFSRYVLVDGEGEPVGYVHLKDVLSVSEQKLDQPIAPKKIRRMLTLLSDCDLEDALAKMQATGIHLARAVNADGATTGVLFFEDIIEQLVGEVQDSTRRGHSR